MVKYVREKTYLLIKDIESQFLHEAGEGTL